MYRPTIEFDPKRGWIPGCYKRTEMDIFHTFGLPRSNRLAAYLEARRMAKIGNKKSQMMKSNANWISIKK